MAFGVGSLAVPIRFEPDTQGRLSLFRTIADFVDGRLRFCGAIREAAPKCAPYDRWTPQRIPWENLSLSTRAIPYKRASTVSW